MMQSLESRPITPTSAPRVVLAHDWLVGLRGGEWVLDRLARLFGPTELYTLVSDGRFLTDAIAACTVITSALQRLPGARGRARRWYLPLMPWAVEHMRVRPDAQLLISTSSAVMKSLQPPPGVPHVCYCHSPARYLWDQMEEYGQGAWGGLRAMGLRAMRDRFRRWDRRTSARVTTFIANSEHTRQRIARCFDREALVVYPPVRTDYFTPDEQRAREDWLLVVAALEPYKQTELVLEAAAQTGWPLKIVGTGSQYRSIQDRAARLSGVEVLGRVDDDRLRELYRRAKTLVFPQVEDFGIVAAEAQACGCPVVGYAGGGAREIITETTGVFMREQNSAAVIKAVNELERKSFSTEACRGNALRFSEARFDAAMLDVVRAALRSATN